jgi:hypothetical protein
LLNNRGQAIFPLTKLTTLYTPTVRNAIMISANFALIRIVRQDPGANTMYMWVSGQDTLGTLGKLWLYYLRGDNDQRDLSSVPVFLNSANGCRLGYWHQRLDALGIRDGTTLHTTV